MDLIDPVTYREYSARPERLRELVAGNPGKRPILIDEVQKVPDLLSVVHQLIEKGPERQFILAGSSARKIRRAGVNLLAGRAVFRTLHPFMAAELGGAFDLNDALAFGLVPLVVGSAATRRRRPDLRGSLCPGGGAIGSADPERGSLLPVPGSHQSLQASVLNISNVARECEVERKTAENYISLLEDLLLACRVSVFRRGAKRKLVAHPRFYLFDAGVFGSLRPRGPYDGREDMSGAALEGLVMQHLRAWNAYRGEPNTIHYWCTRAGVEVDFVLYGQDGIWAVEVKNSPRVRPADLRALKTFLVDYPEGRALLLYRGPERLRIDDISCMPCDTFLRSLHPATAIEEIVT